MRCSGWTMKQCYEEFQIFMEHRILFCFLRSWVPFIFLHVAASLFCLMGCVPKWHPCCYPSVEYCRSVHLICLHFVLCNTLLDTPLFFISIANLILFLTVKCPTLLGAWGEYPFSPCIHSERDHIVGALVAGLIRFHIVWLPEKEWVFVFGDLSCVLHSVQ